MKSEEMIYTVSILEYMLMASLEGASQVFGPVWTASAEKEEVIQALQKMVNKGMLRATEGRFEVCEPYKELIFLATRADRVWTVRGKDPSRLLQYYYMGECVWGVSRCSSHENRLRCTKYLTDDLVTVLCKEERLPMELDEDEGQSDLKETANLELEEIDCLMILDERDRQNHVMREARIGWCAGELLLTWNVNQETRAVPYNLKRLRTLFHKWQEEEEK